MHKGKSVQSGIVRWVNSTEHIVIPRVLIERFLEKSIPDVGEMFSWMRTNKEGDGLSPRLRTLIENLKISGWANLYLDPRNEIKVKLLVLMTPEEVNAFIGDFNAMPLEEQQAQLICGIEEATETYDDEIEAAELTKEEFEALPEAERTALIRIWQLFFSFFFPYVLNYLALMIHRKSLYQLVSEAVQGKDESLLKAIQIDKSVLTTIPYFIERNRRAADEGDFQFQRQINTYRNKPIFLSRPRYPLLWLLLAILDEMNLLSEFERDKEALLDLCQRVGAYGPKNDNADVLSFDKRLREFKRDQNRLMPRPEQIILVKDATSSR